MLHERYPLVTNSTKGLLLSTYLKMLLSDPSNSALQTEVTAVLGKCSHQIDPDLQQRSAEYLVGSTQHPAHCILHWLADLHVLCLCLCCHVQRQLIVANAVRTVVSWESIDGMVADSCMSCMCYR